jgi:xanthine dehydrogenase YagS FAD-binding subunit
MNPFQYVTAGSPDEAISLVGKNGHYLGGGIDLIDEMKQFIVSPDVLVDIKQIGAVQGLDQVGPYDEVSGTSWEKDKNGQNTKFHIGATMTIAQIAAYPDLTKTLPGLVEAASEVGSPQIRNVATLAGNLLQHSRCWYYRQPDIVCLKRGGTTCYGQEGENKYLSLFSGSACISPIVSNLATMLTALNAQVTIKRAKSNKELSMHQLYLEAWTNPAAHNSIEPQDFLLHVSVPLKRTRSTYRQVSEKNEFDWALVSCAAAGNVADGKITDARVVLGAVAPVPYMVEAANEYLEGKPLTDEHASKAADILLKDAKPLAHNGYKVPLAHTLIRRTLLALNA